jgi:uncharacterized iron-regulated protein
VRAKLYDASMRCATASTLLLLALCGCASKPPALDVPAQVAQLLPADAILLGEQHDAAEHQQIERDVVSTLAARRTLSAVVIEMAPRGGTTVGLPAGATEAAVQEALQWDQGAWPWPTYAPPVMAAVRAGVPVAGGNLPRSAMRPAMSDSRLDALLPPAALAAQHEAVREGHCGLLPETQIAPMARVQVARDESLAQTVVQWAAPGKTVLLVAGAMHVDRGAGVPLHLPPKLHAQVVTLRADAGEPDAPAGARADATWHTPKVAPKDYCAELRHGTAGSRSGSVPRS